MISSYEQNFRGKPNIYYKLYSNSILCKITKITKITKFTKKNYKFKTI